MIRMAKSSETEQNLSIIIELFYEIYKTTKNKIFNKSSNEILLKFLNKFS
ncbi:hypothetical protein [Spiroplasma sp. AdecLV25b]|nr:hypothetical protein [Spiroplasma sp. AdecLV25b]